MKLAGAFSHKLENLHDEEKMKKKNCVCFLRSEEKKEEVGVVALKKTREKLGTDYLTSKCAFFCADYSD